MRRRPLAAILVVLLVVSAGCAGFTDGDGTTDGTVTETAEPPTEETPTTETATESPTSTENGSPTEDGDESTETGPPTADSTEEANEVLPVDVYAVWERTRALFDTDAEQPEVRVEDIDEDLARAYESRGDPFQEAVNISETEIDTEGARGLAQGNRVIVDPNEAGPEEIERVLVHEYVHSIQFHEGWFATYRGVDDTTATSTDLGNADIGLVEGGAVWVTDRYAAEHQDEDVDLQSERLAAEYENAPDGDRYFRAPYHFGNQYFDERIDDLDEFSTVFANPPVTTEQLIHGLGPDEEEPTDLEVAVESEDRPVVRNDRLGELFVRVALGSELEESEAAEAAAGWGDDRLVRFDGGETGYVWVLEWDTAEDADEFAAAFDEFLDERTDEYADETRVVRQGPRTVVVVMGPDGFRDAVELDSRGARIVVTVDEGDRRTSTGSGPTSPGRPVDGAAVAPAPTENGVAAPESSVERRWRSPKIVG